MNDENAFWYRDNWTNKDLSYVKNNIITEYDLTAAATNIMYETGIIDDIVYERMMTTDKISREIMVGKLQINRPDVVEKLTAGYREARRLFVQNNNILPENVLSVRRDALYIIGDLELNGFITKKLIFRPKNRYNTFLRYGKRSELYLREDNSEIITKGFYKKMDTIAKDSWLELVREIFILDQKPKQENVIYRKLALLKFQLSTKTADSKFYRSVLEGKYIYDGYSSSCYIPGLDDTLLLNDNFNFLLFLIGVFFEK